MSKLMKDDDAYTFAELPRINPKYKVSRLRHCPLSTISRSCVEGIHWCQYLYWIAHHAVLIYTWLG